MKTAILVSPHFPPSNLAGAQRARLVASHLPEFGWEPIVVTIDPAHYEERADTASLALVPPGLRVERVGALTAGFSRLLGVGDVSLRAHWAMRRRIGDLVRKEKIDLLFATILPGYTSLVGAWGKRKFRLPFVLDYQDPWVSNWGATQPLLSKAGLSHWLATKLEPRVIAAADAVTAVSEETLSTLRDRGLLRPGLPIEIIPIGADEADHRVAAHSGRSVITKRPGGFVLAYFGTIAARMVPIVRTFFKALRLALDTNHTSRMSVQFVGTSAQSNGTDIHSLASLARDCRLADHFELQPGRVGYLDTLRSMHDSDGLLLIGSADPHYTASKIFPYWLANKPIVALIHERSTVNDIARKLGGVRVITYDDCNELQTQVNEVARALREIITCGNAAVPARDESAFALYSARTMAGRYAALFDGVLAAIG
jgi:hypothetical protein